MKTLFTIINLLLISVLVNAQTLVDFETNSLTWAGVAANIDANFSNPYKSGLNTSNTVLKIDAAANDPSYALAYTQNYTPFVVTSSNCIVKILVNKPISSNVTFSLKPNDSTPSDEQTVVNTKINQWEELTFDFSSFIGKTVIELAVFVDNTSNRPTNVTGYFDNISFNDISTLPLKLTSFTGSFDGFNANLNWKTESETNFNKFEVEKSSNGVQFVKIGEIKGGINQYSFTDRDVSFNSTYYYRIKMMDNDGKFTYSNIVAINSKTKANNSFSFYPNPAADFVNINLFSKKDNQITCCIYDLSGKLLLKTFQNANIGNNLIKLNTSKLNLGTYILRITDKDGFIKQQKLIISR